MRMSRMDGHGIQRRPMSNENKMGLMLGALALLAFGGYALLFFVGFIGDMMG